MLYSFPQPIAFAPNEMQLSVCAECFNEAILGSVERNEDWGKKKGITEELCFITFKIKFLSVLVYNTAGNYVL